MIPPITAVEPTPNSGDPRGDIEKMLLRYNLQSERLFGFPLRLGYQDSVILTSDAWKLRNGAPQGKFVILKLCPRLIEAHPELGRLLILGRVLDTNPLPIEEDILLTILELHKLQAVPDPLTNSDLQWSGLKTRLLGTYYDEPGAGPKGKVSFGSDLELSLSPHLYEAYAPADEDLDFLLNLFVHDRAHTSIGRLRYSESLACGSLPLVPIMLSASDLIGYRSGILGVTRLGKSNLLKILADLIIRSGLNVGLLIIDPSGEYSYLNEQDQTSLYSIHEARSVRYSLAPRLPLDEQKLGLSLPRHLGVNFYKQVALGHSVIAGLYDYQHDKRPDYIQPILAWDAVDPDDIDDTFPDYGDRIRYRRSLAMFQALLCKAGFLVPSGFTVVLCLNQTLRQALAKDPKLSSGIAKVRKHGKEEIDEHQTPEAAGRIYAQLYELYQREHANSSLFPPSKSSGLAYFDLVQTSLLRMHGDTLISGAKKFSPFLKFHHPTGSHVIQEIVDLIDAGRVVILDLSIADEEIAGLLSTLICKAILRNQIKKFSKNRLEDHFVHFVFEEAHKLFPSDDHDLQSIYNVMAKEGAKYHVGMCYATQSISTISPDLLKNTENLFVVHMSDERELKLLSNRNEFKDLTASIQRARTRGYVHMLSLSNRFVIPVQIHKFGTPGQ